MVRNSSRTQPSSTPTKPPHTPGSKGGKLPDETKQIVEELKGMIVSLRSEVSVLTEASKATTNALSQIQEALTHEKKLNEELKLTVSSQEQLINHLQLRHKQMDERVLYLEQYSRKDVVTLTGLSYHEHESDLELRNKVCHLLNTLQIPTYNDEPYFTFSAFSAIHRNGRRGNRGKPPTVTVKFLSLMDKDLVMKNKSQLRRMNPGTNLFHSMAMGTRDVKSKLEQSKYVKFAEYNGMNEGFSVCLVDRRGWISKIRSSSDLDQRLTELNVENKKSYHDNDIENDQVLEEYDEYS